MPCTCTERDERETYHSHHPLTKRPNTPCIYCAEKHIDTAAADAREYGYEGANRGYVIGEIRAAEIHLHSIPDAAAQELCTALRELRHKIQDRREDPASIDFDPYMAAIDAIIRADLAAEESASES